jgi:hypothetical protein
VDRDELYALAPDRFVAERNALAKQLRADGRRDEAGEVAALRKPSVAARAVNRLAREHARQMTALLTAGDELIDVQSRLVSGDATGQDLARAAEREREAVSELVAKAGALLADEGQPASPTVLERVSETLHAAALDADARPAVREGRLERELRHVGFWTGGDESAPAARPAEERQSKAAKAEAQEQAKAALQREAARKDARTAVTDARRASSRAEKALTSAQRAREKAAGALMRAEEEDRAAQEALESAGAEAEEASEAQGAAERELQALSDD